MVCLSVEWWPTDVIVPYMQNSCSFERRSFSKGVIETGMTARVGEWVAQKMSTLEIYTTAHLSSTTDPQVSRRKVCYWRRECTDQSVSWREPQTLPDLAHRRSRVEARQHHRDPGRRQPLHSTCTAQTQRALQAAGQEQPRQCWEVVQSLCETEGAEEVADTKQWQSPQASVSQGLRGTCCREPSQWQQGI